MSLTSDKFRVEKGKLIVLPGLIDHQYAKFVARYGILVDSAILKSIIFDDFVDFVDFMDGRQECPSVQILDLTIP